MARSFSEWKAMVILRLLEMKRKYSSDEKILRDINVLLSKLQYLRVRDLSTWLVLLYHAASDLSEFLELLPRLEDLDEWFEKEE